MTVPQKSLNVLDFGATGDGITDDTAAIQAAWTIAEEWYNEEQIFSSLQRDDTRVLDAVRTREFATWMTNEYRLAMAKGIQIGRGEVKL